MKTAYWPVVLSSPSIRPAPPDAPGANRGTCMRNARRFGHIIFVHPSDVARVHEYNRWADMMPCRAEAPGEWTDAEDDEDAVLLPPFQAG